MDVMYTICVFVSYLLGWSIWWAKYKGVDLRIFEPRFCFVNVMHLILGSSELIEGFTEEALQ